MFIYEFTWIFNWEINHFQYYHLIKSIIYSVLAIPCFFVLLGILAGLLSFSLSFLHIILFFEKNKKVEKNIDNLLKPILH